MTRRWWLPEGVDELVPPGSWDAEALRRRLLDHYRERGYELVLTPIVEHLDALLTGTGSDLEQQTFKLVDPASGRLLGLRADITPQAARIAARRYAAQKVVRLCYLGTVLRAQSDSLGGSRSPRQVGCELFGEAGIDADLEILQLMLETVRRAGVKDLHLDLGHVGLYRALSERIGLDPDDESALFSVMQRKSAPDLAQFAGQRRLKPGIVRGLAALMDLNGGTDVLKRARSAVRSIKGAAACLEALEHTVARLRRIDAGLPIHIDLAELRGYRYQTGMVFAAFAPGHGRELARGGRYDGIGHEFGVPRPATGFSADLNELLRLGTTRARPRRNKG